MNRRQSRPFQGKKLPPEAALVPPPSPDLLEHLEEVFSTPTPMELANRIGTGPEMAHRSLYNVAYEAGMEEVLSYLRELLHRHTTGEA